ncbi:MAG: ABC transporter ATP-binding protein [Marinicaulis sp.]|nr:ABC transporter ATP-binding protein [Marinicaulis sp.]
MQKKHFIRIENVTKRFGQDAPPALDAIDAEIATGRITGLVGPDGAGKTTLIRLLTGLSRPNEGRVLINGKDATRSHTDLHRMIGYMPQKFGLYEDLTVQENLDIYANLKGLPSADRQATFDELLEFTDLARFTGRLAGSLSGGMKQKLGLACALLKRPRLLLLDEPSVGVDPISRRELWRMVQTLVDDTMAVIWSTAYLDEAEHCDHVLLLNEGRLLFAGPPADLTRRVEGRVFLAKPRHSERRAILSRLLSEQLARDAIIHGDAIRILVKDKASIDGNTPPPAIVEVAGVLEPVPPRFEDAFVDALGGGPQGRSLLADAMTTHAVDGSSAVEARGLTKRYGDFTAASNISFSIKRGEIFGLLGPNGAGKSTTFKMLCGLLTPSEGEGRVAGFDLRTATADARGRLGYMAQKFSLYGELSVAQNLAFFAGVYGLDNKRARHRIETMLDVFELTQYRKVSAKTLPLGFKQRLALAAALLHEPDVLFLDEPTSGVDPITRREFWNHINALTAQNVAVLVTTHFMEEAEYCDRINLIYRGRTIAEGTPDDLRNAIRSPEIETPTMEDAFIELVRRSDAKEAA